MKLYHGSNMEIEKIDLSCSKPNKDFGRAFYLSDVYEQAVEMARFKSVFLGGKEVVTTYEIDETIFMDKTLKFKEFDGYSEEWAHFIYEHRNDEQGRTLHDFDVVYGPIANDRVGAQINNFRNGYISFDTFIERIKYMKGITFQYAFCTELAISKLVRV